MSRMIERLEEFRQKGVANIWLIDPRLRKMFVFTQSSLQEVTGDVIATGDPHLELTREEIFQQ